AASGGGPLGLGILLGDPTGFTGKYWMDQRSAADFGLAFDFGDYFVIYGDYLYHFPGALGAASKFAKELTPYVGIGGMIAFSSHDHPHRHHDHDGFFHDTDSSVGLGIRIPFGIEWRPSDAPIGVFV